MRAARTTAVVIALVASATPVALAQSDFRVVIDNAAWNGGTAWVGSQGAQIRITRPSWGNTVQHGLYRGSYYTGGTSWAGMGGSDYTRTWWGLAEGAYTVRAQVKSVVTCRGSICSFSSDTRTGAFSVDLTAPGTPAVHVPADPVGSADAIHWTPVGDSGAGLARYEVLVDGTRRAEVAPGMCVSRCSATVPAEAMPDGTRQVDVRAVDAVGNVATASAWLTVRDTPQVSLVDPPAGAWTGDRLALRAHGTVPNGGALTYDWDLDGDGEFETGSGADPSATLVARRSLTVRVRASAPGGGRATAEHALRVQADPGDGGEGDPAELGEPGVSIEGGARFVRRPRVDLALRWPDGATHMRIATDGGFRGAGWQPVAAAAQVTLDADEATDDRLPHVVYVRFRGPGVNAADTYTDDVILDTTPPVVNSVVATPTARGQRIRARARDAVSGVARVQVATGTGRKVITRRYGRAVVVLSATARPRVRVIDRAGNRSRWVPATIAQSSAGRRR